MAVLTHTVVSHDPVGENSLVTGSITVPNAAKNHMVLLPTTGYILSCTVSPTTEQGSEPLVALNKDTDVASLNGSVLIETAALCTLNYAAVVAGGPF